MQIKVLKPLHVKGKTIDISEKTWDINELGLSVENAKTLIKVEAIEEVDTSATLSNNKKGNKDVKKRQ